MKNLIHPTGLPFPGLSLTIPLKFERDPPKKGCPNLAIPATIVAGVVEKVFEQTLPSLSSNSPSLLGWVFSAGSTFLEYLPLKTLSLAWFFYKLYGSGQSSEAKVHQNVEFHIHGGDKLEGSTHLEFPISKEDLRLLLEEEGISLGAISIAREDLQKFSHLLLELQKRKACEKME